MAKTEKENIKSDKLNEIICLWEYIPDVGVAYPVGISEEHANLIKNIAIFNRRTKITIEILDDGL